MENFSLWASIWAIIIGVALMFIYIATDIDMYLSRRFTFKKSPKEILEEDKKEEELIQELIKLNKENKLDKFSQIGLYFRILAHTNVSLKVGKILTCIGIVGLILSIIIDNILN